jgi:hypothetical protein
MYRYIFKITDLETMWGGGHNNVGKTFESLVGK